MKRGDMPYSGWCPAAVLSLLLVACTGLGGPEYQRPAATPAKPAWSRPVTPSAATAIAPDWWKTFGDAYLDGLIDRAVAGNVDIAVLAARIQIAAAAIDEARAGALPTAQATASASYQKSTGQPLAQQFSLGTQLNWEVDVWGKVAKGVQAQKAGYRASEADWRAGYLALAANVSTAYFQILQFDEQIGQQQQTLEKNQEILAVYENMLASGLVPQTQVLRQRAEINGLTKDLIELRRRRDLAENAIGTLMGVPAGEFKVPAGSLQRRVRLPAVPVGLPSDLLERRPDVLAAEYRLLEAYDLVDQARLARLPSISLTGTGGSASQALATLLRSFTFGFVPSISLPMLDPGAKARIRSSEARTQVARQQYRQAVMAAFEEVENALVNLEAHKQQRTELEQQAAHLQVVAGQIRIQLQEGLVSQLEVFESERSLLAAQLALLANYQQILSDTVTLYKTLGGGWPAASVRNAE